MVEILDVKEVMSRNPVSTLSKINQSSLIQKVQETFTGEEQEIFVGNLMCYLGYHPTKDFVVNLNDVWKWLGFSRKDPAKRLLQQHFEKERDFLIQGGFPPNGGKPNDRNLGGRPKEKITMNIRTFKKFCLKADTEKADKVHDYYVKLEDLFHEHLNEQLSLKDKEIELRDKKIKEKEKMIEDQQEKIKRKTPNLIYIAHNKLVKNLYQIGITSDVQYRERTHKTSDPNFDYLFTHTIEDPENIEAATLIEKQVKAWLRPWSTKSPLLFKPERRADETFEVDYQTIYDTTTFCIALYERYKIHKDVEQLRNFLRRYNNDRLIYSYLPGVKYFTTNIYKKFLDENIVWKKETPEGKETRTPLVLIVRDFEKWCSKNNIEPQRPIRSKNNELSTHFVKDITKNINELTNIKNEHVSITDRKRGYKFSKVSGWKGFELKSMDNDGMFYVQKAYEEYVDKNIIVTNNQRNKLLANVLITDFIEWCSKNNYECLRKKDVVAKGKYSNVFQDEIKNNIQNITGKEFYPNKTLRGKSGVFWCLQLRGKPQTEGNNSGETITRGNKRKVYRFDKNKKLIKTYNSINDAMEDEHFASATLKKRIADKTILRNSFWSFEKEF